MYIITDYNDTVSSKGNTLEEAFENFENEYSDVDYQDMTFYEVKELKVTRKFEIVKE